MSIKRRHLSMKTEIQDKEYLPLDKQRHSVGGDELKDGGTLAYYNIQKKSTIE